MAYELVWSAEAEDDFKKIIFYLKEVLSVQSSQVFIHTKRISVSVSIIEDLFHKIKQCCRKNSPLSFLKNRFPVAIVF